MLVTAVGNSNKSFFQKHFSVGIPSPRSDCAYIKLLRVQPVEKCFVLNLTAVMTVTELVINNGMIKSFGMHLNKSG